MNTNSRYFIFILYRFFREGGEDRERDRDRKRWKEKEKGEEKNRF
jgi:hypothetical protein